MTTTPPVEPNRFRHLARIAAGMSLIAAGAAALILPGPGVLIILVGLGLLPYPWARNVTRMIRARIPGVPEEGRLPRSAWIQIAVVAAAAVALTVAFGDDLRSAAEHIIG